MGSSISPFDPSLIDAVARVLGRTDGGLSGNEIGRALSAARISDPVGDAQRAAPAGTYVRGSKRDRIRDAVLAHQTRHHNGAALVAFINRAMAIVGHIDDPDKFRRWQQELNEVLIVAGLRVNDEGKIATAGRVATTLDEVTELAGRVHRRLRDLDCHSEAIRYCDVELLRRSNFHAASEAVKGIFERIRETTGVVGDGPALVDEVFGFRNQVPRLAMSMLGTETDQSEQTGLMNLIKGLYGLYRNPLAHRTRVAREAERPVSETELVGLLVAVSLAHRFLDRCATDRQA